MRGLRPALVIALLSLAAPLLAQAPAASPAPDVANAAALVGAPRSPTLSGAALDARTEEVAALLRCPVCQGLSVGDSPSTMAVSMKGQVRELLARGFDEEQVLAYFEASYGEFVRLKPPLRGVNWLVWVAPGLALLAGGVAVALSLRRNAAAAPAAEEVPGRDTLPDDPQLAAYVRRVRELAYGWPGGVPPMAPPREPAQG